VEAVPRFTAVGHKGAAVEDHDVDRITPVAGVEATVKNAK
jgi:hypothetical protein